MPALPPCTECGAELRDTEQNDLCTRCLLSLGLSVAGDSTDSDAAPVALGTAAPLVSGFFDCRFGDYELLEEIARGGMGVVYKARQVSLGRNVALKMILAGQFAAKEFVQRFRGEAAAAAILQHPNIVAIHEVGIYEGQHFFSMDYVEGRNMAQLVGSRPLPPHKAARYVKLIAVAIHYAHQQGILHRDLKPSNVLIDDATDQPRVTDFGLARRLDGESSLTVTGQVLGSPNFMPPEQASGSRGKVGRHSDVYGLGGILYFLLTARAPFQAESLEGIVTQVLNTEPVPPRLLNPAVPRDLETICLKCLEKEPAKRYPTAQALADELDRFLNNEPIHARPLGKPGKAWRWCRRKPVVASLASGLVLALIAGFAGVLWQWRRAEQNALNESAQRERTEHNLYTSDMNLVHEAWRDGNLQRAEALLRAHLPQAGKKDLRGFEWRYLWQLCQDESRFTFTNINLTEASFTFTGGRQRLVPGANGRLIIAASDDTLKWLDPTGGREVQTVKVSANITGPLATAVNQPGLLVYRADKIKAISPTGEVLLSGGVTHEDCLAIALSPDGRLLASGGWTDLKLWDVVTGAQIGPGLQLGEGSLSLVFSPDGKYLVAGTSETKVHILEVPSLKRVKVLEGHTAWVKSLAFDPGGKLLASGGNDSAIIMWSFPEGREIARFAGHRGSVGELAFSPDGRRLASGGTDHTVRLWSPANPGMHTILHGHRSGVKCVLFSSDGTELYTGSDDGTVKVWPVSSAESTNILRHQHWLWAVAFSPDGNLLAVADHHARTAVLWDVRSRTRVRNVGQFSTVVHAVKFSPDGKLLAVGGDDETVQLWNITEDQMIFGFRKGSRACSLAFHPLAPILAVVSGDLRFWNTLTGRETNLLVNPPGVKVEGVAFSPDGKWMAAGMQNGTISIWNLATGKESSSFRERSSANASPPSVLSFSHDGTLLASGGKDNQIVLYDLSRQRMINRLDAHTHEVRWLAFTPDSNKTLVSTSLDGTIKFWSVANQQLALTLAHDGGPVTSVAFSPDGKIMATSGSDGTVRLWPAPTLAEIDKAERERQLGK